MKTQFHSTRRAALVVLLTASCAPAAILLDDFDLGTANRDNTVWTNLTSSNAGSGSSLAPASGNGTGTVGAPGFKASSGLYSFSTDYSVTFDQSSTFDISNVVFQLELAPNPDLAWPLNGGAILSINGGAYEIAADTFLVGRSEERNTFGTDPVTYTSYTWQWDLSESIENIPSVSILTPITVHSSATAASLDTADAFTGYVTPVPEPSALLISLTGSVLLLFRRR